MVCGVGDLSGIRRGCRTFGGLGMQGYYNGSSVKNIFEDSCIEEGTGVGRLYSKGGSIFQPLRKGGRSTAQLQQYRYRNTDLHLYPPNIIKKLRVN